MRRLGHAEQPELIELIEGGMGEHVNSAGRGYWGGGSSPVRAARLVGVAVQVIVEDRSDGTVGPCPDVECARRGGLDCQSVRKFGSDAISMTVCSN